MFSLHFQLFFHLKRNLLYLLLLFSLISCTTSRKYYKAAERLEKKGLYNEAAELYLVSLERNKTNADANIKLREVGQKYVDYLASSFYWNFSIEQDEKALEYYDNLTRFVSKCKILKIDLEFPKSYNDDYSLLVDRYCDKNYHEGLKLFRRERYAEALVSLRKVFDLKANYRDIERLMKISKCEPLYQSAIRNIELKNYQPALTNLKGIIDNYSDYKDSKELFNIFSQVNIPNVLIVPTASTDSNNIKQTLLNSFINLKQRGKSSVKIIHNPILQLNKPEINFDLMQALRKATGAKYFFVFDVTDKKVTKPPVKKESYTCYRRISENNISSVIIKYLPSFYNSITSQRTYSYVFRYKLFNMENMQSVMTENRNINKIDVVNYHEFSVFSQKSEITNYFPYHPNNTPLDQQYDCTNWRSKFNAKRELKSVDELERSANNDVFGIFSDLILNYVK